jgi:3-methyladenine DNA glycosylase AlkD
MPTLHSQLLTELKRHAGNGTQHTGNAGYLENAPASYHISNPVKRVVAWEFLAAPSHDEKSMAAMILGYARQYRARVTPAQVDAWLGHLIGWAEVDSLCQSNFTAEEMFLHWLAWRRMLVAFSKQRKNISNRRASLVLLTGPVAHSRDARFARVAFENISRLCAERDILITKAISWLLRSMVWYHRRAVVAYVRENAATLPAIAVRETTRKIKMGRK